MQKEWQPKYLYLYSQRGYQYCDLLLGLERIEDVKKRAKKMLEWEVERSLLDIALNKLSLGRAYLTKYQKAKSKIMESLPACAGTSFGG